MRSIILTVTVIICISIILLGCQSNESSQSPKTEIPDDKITKVSISRSKEFGKVNTNFFGEYEDEETLVMFEHAFASAERQEGVVDMAEPEFDVEVIYKDREEKGYHLWIGEVNEISTLMRVEDTHIINHLSGEITNQLKELIH